MIAAPVDGAEDLRLQDIPSTTQSLVPSHDISMTQPGEMCYLWQERRSLLCDGNLGFRRNKQVRLLEAHELVFEPPKKHESGQVVKTSPTGPRNWKLYVSRPKRTDLAD